MATEQKKHLSLDDVRFFERAMDAYADVKGTDAAEDFFKPIDYELGKKGLLVATHKECSRFLEVYIRECPLDCLEHLFRTFQGKFNDLSQDKFASHSVELMIDQASNLVGQRSFTELLSSLITELKVYAPSLAEDPAGSHVIRAVLEKLSKHKALDKKIDKFARSIINAFKSQRNRIRSTQFSATLQDIAKLDKELYPDIHNYLLSTIPCQYEHITDRSGSQLIESAIKNIGAPATTAVYNTTLKTSAVDVANDQFGNFVVQRWLENDKNNQEMTQVLNQLIPEIPNFMRYRIQIIVSMSIGAAKSTPQVQKSILDTLFSLAEGKNLVDYLSAQRPPNGSKILQGLCHFDKSINSPFVEEMLKLNASRLSDLALDKNGTFLMSEFIKSKTIDEKKKFKVIRRLLPKMKELALDRKGTYVVEASFNAGDITIKKSICKELNDESIKNGAKLMWDNFRIHIYANRPDQWEKDINTMMRARESMRDIIEDEEIPDVKPIAPEIVPPTKEMEEASKDLEDALGTLHKKKHRRHRHHHEDNQAPEE